MSWVIFLIGFLLGCTALFVGLAVTAVRVGSVDAEDWS